MTVSNNAPLETPKAVEKQPDEVSKDERTEWRHVMAEKATFTTSPGFLRRILKQRRIGICFSVCGKMHVIAVDIKNSPLLPFAFSINLLIREISTRRNQSKRKGFSFPQTLEPNLSLSVCAARGRSGLL